jgi:hypothetical protein
MKKTLLLAVAICSATAGFAQMTTTRSHNARVLPTLMSAPRQLSTVNDPFIAQPRKSKTDGTYYLRPAGSLYYGWNAAGMGTGYTIVDVTPWAQITFANMLTTKGGSWSVNGTAADASNVSNGDYVGAYSASGLYYAPTLTNGTKKYTIGENNIFLRKGQIKINGLIGTDSISAHYACDDHAAYLYKGSYYSNVLGWGALDTENMYGTGNYVVTDKTTGESTNYPSYAVAQAFEKPMSPLYVEDVFVRGVSFSKPIAEKDTLYAYITNVDTFKTSSGDIKKAAGDKVYQVLYATAKDTVDFGSTETRDGKTLYSGVVKFSKKTLDEFGLPTTEPFVLNDEFCVVISGFDKAGIDFGPTGLEYDAEDTNVADAVIMTKKPDGTAGYTVWYTGSALNVGLNSVFDAIQVPVNNFLKTEPTGVKWNVLRLSDDGKTCTTDGQTGDNALAGAIVGTAMPYYDVDGNENYEVTDKPDWITGVTVDETTRSDWGGFSLMSVTGTALPSGTAKRACQLYIKGKGVYGNNPVIVLQGTATVFDAINTITNDNKATNGNIYNLNGQQVNKNYKGVVIENGQKRINK